ncbi:MAG: hypothetical protein ACR2PB_05420 [Desulfocapsaceae bacterium]
MRSLFQSLHRQVIHVVDIEREEMSRMDLVWTWYLIPTVIPLE